MPPTLALLLLTTVVAAAESNRDLSEPEVDTGKACAYHESEPYRVLGSLVDSISCHAWKRWVSKHSDWSHPQ
jgi:hypothetical protein